MTETPIRVLFLCTHNSARSQLAEALLVQQGGGQFEARSAGTEATSVNPLAIQALAEIGIDWSSAFSKQLTEFLGQRFDYVITVCDDAREACPVFPGARRMLHWGLLDPSRIEGSGEHRLEAFRHTRDKIRALVQPFIEAALLERAEPDARARV